MRVSGCIFSPPASLKAQSSQRENIFSFLLRGQKTKYAYAKTIIIQLAIEQNATLLLIDDRKGRKTAKKRGIHIIGTGGVLIVAKKAGLLAEVSPVLKELASIGYRLSPALCERIIELADEC